MYENPVKIDFFPRIPISLGLKEEEGGGHESTFKKL